MTNTNDAALATFTAALIAACAASKAAAATCGSARLERMGVDRGSVVAVQACGLDVGTVTVEWRAGGYKYENVLTNCTVENGQPHYRVLDALEAVLGRSGLYCEVTAVEPYAAAWTE